MTEPDSLLAKVLKSKYFPTCHFLKAKRGHKASYSWQSINKASWILKRGCFWLLGNGKDINIWEDRWLHPMGQNPTWTPKPSNTNLEKVSDIINPSSNNWDSQTISQIFIPMEADRINQIPIPSPMEDDIISWQGTSNGLYTVKSGYNAQIEWEYDRSKTGQPSTNNMEKAAWKNLWKTKVPPKQIHLIWRILHNAIPLKPNLIKKGIKCDSLCPRCYEAIETLDHTFLHCDWVRQIWFSSPLTINTSLMRNHSFRDWIFYMLTNSNTECIQQIISITYSIWWTRNKKVFQNSNTPVIEALDQALKSIHEFHHHTTLACPNLSSQAALANRNNKCWTPPPRSFLKLNVDAHLHDDGHWGYGMLLRSEDGRAVGAKTKVLKGTGDATLAEAVGIYEALQWLKTQNYHKVIIESDAEIVTKAVTEKRFPRTNWGNVARRISRDLNKYPNVTAEWVNRNGNKAAHDLARMAISNPNRFWPNNFPPCILAHILSDMEGVICNSN
jgi:ribonuclease HI